MKLEQFYNMADKTKDYIVKLKYKHDSETKYTISNEVCSYYWSIYPGEDQWQWFNDWCEGETDVEVLDFCPVEDIFNNRRFIEVHKLMSFLERYKSPNVVTNTLVNILASDLIDYVEKLLRGEEQ